MAPREFYGISLKIKKNRFFFRIILVFWATELDTDPSNSIYQPSSIDHRSRGTVLDILIPSSISTRARSSSRYRVPFSEIDGRSSSVDISSSMDPYRARLPRKLNWSKTKTRASVTKSFSFMLERDYAHKSGERNRTKLNIAEHASAVPISVDYFRWYFPWNIGHIIMFPLIMLFSFVSWNRLLKTAFARNNSVWIYYECVK